MNLSPITVLAHKPDYKNTVLKSVISFIAMITFIIIGLYYLHKSFGKLDNASIFVIILIPFLVFMIYMRSAMQKSDEMIQLTISENGIYYKPLHKTGIENFVPWTRLKTVDENLMKSKTNDPNIVIKLTRPYEKYIITSSDVGMDSLVYFLIVLKKFRFSLLASQN